MIIDAHTHIGKMFGWIEPAEGLISAMNKVGIDKAVVSTLLDTPGPDPQDLEILVKAVAKYPNRLIGFARINPWFGDEALLEFEREIKNLNFRGLKLQTAMTTIGPDWEAVLLLLRRAEELNVPVLYHSGDEPLSLPLQIGKAAEACPAVTIIMGHMGGYFFHKDAVRVAKKFDNILLETSLMPYPKVIRKAIDELGAERVVFGSDACPSIIDPRVELLKIQLSDLSRKEKELVLGRNMARILHIGEN